MWENCNFEVNMKKGFSLLFGLLALCSCKQENIYLSEQDSGSDVILNIGQRAVITLAENPTTGYAWVFEIEPKNQKTIEIIREKYIYQKNNLIGAGGIKELTFKAENTGKTDIYGYYVRSWEKWDKNKVQSVHYTIIAK